MVEIPLDAVARAADLAFAALQPGKTALEGLVHGGVIIARHNAFNVEAPVVGFQWPVQVEYHAGCHGGFAAAVADVEAFHALHRGIGAQRQADQAARNR